MVSAADKEKGEQNKKTSHRSEEPKATQRIRPRINSNNKESESPTRAMANRACGSACRGEKK